MKVLIFLCALWAVSYAANDNVCYNAVETFCTEGTNTKESCSACYGGFVNDLILGDVQSYANAHIASSFEYLLLSTNFGGYVRNRKGFEKLYRLLSDTTWEDAIDLIKYISKRGGSMDFYRKLNNTDYIQPKADEDEIGSLAHSVDIHKNLAALSFDLHKKASGKENHEPEVASYLENNFLHKHANIIRSLTGYISDVKRLRMNPEHSSVSLFLFDEYLQDHTL